MSGLKPSDLSNYPELILYSEDQRELLSITEAVSTLHPVMKANQMRTVVCHLAVDYFKSISSFQLDDKALEEHLTLSATENF